MLKTKSTFVAVLLAVGFLGLTTFAQTASQGLEFPYQALVLRDGASVHSGPGQVHYETQSLKQSAAVEVYRHDPGGWCAIRPLQGSFSLVPESTLKIVSKGVGEIDVDGTQAWVGTKAGPVDKPLWQVKLKKGELVEVIGQVSWPDPKGHSTVWYQIAPPAGEFRWIKMSDLQLPVSARLAIEKPLKAKPTLPTDSMVRSMIAHEIQGPSASPTAAPLPPTAIVPLIASRIQTATNESADAPEVQLASMQTDLNAPQASTNGGWRQAKRPIRNRAVANNSNSSSYQRESYESNRPDDYSGAPGTSSSYGKSPDINYRSETQPARVPTDRYADASLSRRNLARNLNSARASNFGSAATLNNTAPALNNISAATFLTTHRIDDLELLLTREMLRDPDQWKLDDLEVRASSISRMTTDPNERILAEKFLKKIENCRTIKYGFESQAGVSLNGVSRNGVLGNGVFGNGATGNAIGNIGVGSAIGSMQSGSNVALGTTYDAHGWLNQMVSDGGQGNPTYVLQDENGRITHHVSPVQGMNMHRYLKTQVGIIGQRGYHKRLKLDHVTAHRVVELQRR